MKDNFNHVKYVDRDKAAGGDMYGIGEPPKMGKMRSSFMDTDIPQKSKTVGHPPKKIS